MRPFQPAPVLFDVISMRGGMDQITPTLNLRPGVCTDALNHECYEGGGYARVAGYERFSGQPKPSNAVYALLYVSGFMVIPSAGNTITNGGGTATGVVVAVGPNFVAYTKATGTFVTGDTIKVGVTTIGKAIDPLGGVNPETDASYVNLAADAYRADIAAPTGSGAIIGVFVYNDLAYCLRQNGGTVTLYKQSGAGWTAVAMLYEVAFSNANTNVNDGDTLTQGGVTATIRRVVVETGTLVSGVNTGRLITTAPGGGNFVAGAATSTGAGALTLGGAATAITLAPGGRAEIVQANFYGQAVGTRVYCADGVNRMWEFDGTNLVPLTTGGLIPKHIVVHKKYLFYSVGSSIFYRAVGDPYLTTGGGEIAVGDTVTGFLIMPGAQTSAALAVLTRNGTNMLYGTDSTTWNLVSYNFGTGALDYTMQNMAQSCMLDDRGVFTLQTSLNFGNFEQQSLTHLIRPFITEHRPYVQSSGLNRLKSQYRVFYSDGWGLYITLVANTFMGAMPVKFPMSVTCWWESTLSNGTNIMLAGGSDGQVYEFDVGTSFDGTAIEAWITLNWNAMKNPRLLKRMRGASVEVAGTGYAKISFGYMLGYGSSDYAQDGAANYPVNINDPKWESFTWDTFTWDGQTTMPTYCEMQGTAENVQITLASNSDTYQPYIINSAIVRYSPRRALRN